MNIYISIKQPLLIESQVMTHVFNYLGQEESLKFQALNRRFYETKMGKIQTRIKLQEYVYYADSFRFLRYDLKNKHLFELGSFRDISMAL